MPKVERETSDGDAITEHMRKSPTVTLGRIGGTIGGTVLLGLIIYSVSMLKWTVFRVRVGTTFQRSYTVSSCRFQRYGRAYYPGVSIP